MVRRAAFIDAAQVNLVTDKVVTPLSFGMLQLVSWQANVEACVKHVAQHALSMDLKVKDFLLLHGHFVEASTNDGIAGQRHHHKEKEVAGVDQM